jgi:hypothetical protein
LEKLYETDGRKSDQFDTRENELEIKKDKVYNSRDSLDAVNDQFTGLFDEYRGEIYSIANKVLQNTAAKSPLWYSALALKHRSTDIPDEKKEAKKILKKENMRNIGDITTFGIVGGYGYGKMQHVDLSIAAGALDRITSVFSLVGYSSIGFEYGIDERIDAIKMTAGIHAPVTFLLSPMLFHGYDRWKFGVRPEIGFALKTLSFSYGYTWVNKDVFNPARGHIFKARIYVPLYRPEREYAHYRGNNIYWE